MEPWIHMTNNPVQENANAEDHVVNIWQVNQDRLTLMHQKLADSPQILSQSAGQSSCCIFRAPQNLVDINGRCYQPHIVSIGPYHHGDPRLRMIEEHKWRFLNGLLKRTESKGLTLEDYLKAVQPLEAEARECYSATILSPTDEFIEILVLDGCFVIELFRKFCGVVEFEADDPLLSLSWVYPFFLKDLIRLENQIPFFVLDHLFDLTQMPDDMPLSLSCLTLMFFNNALQLSDKYVEKSQYLQGKHLLDFLRASFIPVWYGPNQRKCKKPNVIHCISKLRRAGIELRADSSDSSDNFLSVEFRHGVIKMPTITVDDFMRAFLLNCVAYEQCHRDFPRHVTTYATLLDCLINTAKDVEYLCDEKIIENCLGTNAEIAKFINNMGKEVQFDIDTYMCYLSDMFDDVNNYYNNQCHLHWASFKYRYFNTPWSCISAAAAFVLLVLTVTQTFYTIITYVRPR